MKTSFPKSELRVLLLEGVHDRAVELFDAEGFDVQREKGALAPDQLAARLDSIHLLGIRSKTQLESAHIAVASRLIGVGCFCIGTNQVDLRAACAAGIPVFNSPFSNTRSVAELTIAEIVALQRRLADHVRRMHAGDWRKESTGAHEVRGRTLGIIGYGHIGSQVSVLAEALGMHVVYHDVLQRLPLGNARPMRTLDDLLKVSDVVTLHVPAGASTRNLIDDRAIKRMRPGATLINNARGSVVDLDALAEALASGHIAGAAIDVFPEEPEASTGAFTSALCGLPNVILTPHIGGSTSEAQEGIASDVATKLIRFVNNGSTTGAVNVPEVELPEQAHDYADAAGDRSHRILHFHRNVPGVLGKMHALIAERGVNVSAEYLRTNESIGYVVLDVDPTDAAPVIEGLRAIPETIRLRVLW
jgi:D-3-phosphoglycerate dehydrogenase